MLLNDVIVFVLLAIVAAGLLFALLERIGRK